MLIIVQLLVVFTIDTSIHGLLYFNAVSLQMTYIVNKYIQINQIIFDVFTFYIYLIISS